MKVRMVFEFEKLEDEQIRLELLGNGNGENSQLTHLGSTIQPSVAEAIDVASGQFTWEVEEALGVVHPSTCKG